MKSFHALRCLAPCFVLICSCSNCTTHHDSTPRHQGVSTNDDMLRVLPPPAQRTNEPSQVSRKMR